MMLFYLAVVISTVVSLESTKTVTSELHEFQLNNSAGVMAALDMLPKDCKKNGKTYKAGEDFQLGNLRYKCQNYGVYTIEGCKRSSGQDMKLGESVVEGNIKYQCLGMGSAVFYKETTCGIMEQPECDKVPLPKGFEEAVKKNGGKTEKPVEGKTEVGGVQLPKGWSLVDGGRKPITGTNASVVTQILMFNPVQTRVKRQGGHGIGSVVGVETMSGDQIGKPLSSKVVGTQTVGARLGTIKKGDKHDTDLEDLMSRRETKVEGADKMKAGSVRGSKSDVDWKGRKVIVNGKTVGVGEGTFSFGNKPTA